MKPSLLKQLNACTSGREWADAQIDYKTAWENCERGDWMLWIAQKQNIDIRILTKAKVECAKLVEHLMKDERSINALRVAEKFADGLATREEMGAAYADAAAYAAASGAYAAYAAADAAAVYATDAAVYAADAAVDADADADAADAAYAAAYAAAAAYAYADADAADAAYAAADAYADAYARKNTLKRSAEICRQYIDFDLLVME